MKISIKSLILQITTIELLTAKIFKLVTQPRQMIRTETAEIQPKQRNNILKYFKENCRK